MESNNPMDLLLAQIMGSSFSLVFGSTDRYQPWLWHSWKVAVGLPVIRDVATGLWACRVGNEKYRLEDKAVNSPDICEAA